MTCTPGLSARKVVARMVRYPSPNLIWARALRQRQASDVVEQLLTRIE